MWVAGTGPDTERLKQAYPADRRIQYIHQARLISLIRYSLKAALSAYVFEAIDGQGSLFREIESVARTFLRNLWRSGALFGKREKEAFIARCDENNNPGDEIAAGRVNLDVGVRLVDTAETILFHLNNVPNSQDLSVLQQ